MLERFPQAKSKEKAIHYLVRDYIELNRPDKAQGYMDMLKTQYPKSSFLQAGSLEGKTRQSSRKQQPSAQNTAPLAVSTAPVPSDYSEKVKKEIALTPIEEPTAKTASGEKALPAETLKNSDSPIVVAKGKTESEVKTPENVLKDGKASADKEDRLGFFSGNGPIEIDGDSGESLEKGKVLSFKGNVIAKQISPDPTQTFYLFCDRLTAYTNEDTKEIEKLEARGNVRLVKQDKTATAQQAFYSRNKDKSQVVLQGDVVIFLGSDKLSADTVTYFVEEDRFLVQGDKDKRAKATINPKK
jgi:lipopolysaccharide export system protein LptA